VKNTGKTNLARESRRVNRVCQYVEERAGPTGQETGKNRFRLAGRGLQLLSAGSSQRKIVHKLRKFFPAKTTKARPATGSSAPRRNGNATR